MKRVALLIALITLLAQAQIKPKAPQDLPPLDPCCRLSLSVQRQPTADPSPFLLELTFENTSLTAMYTLETSPERNYVSEVLKEKGLQPVAMTPTGKLLSTEPEIVTANFHRRLEPGERVVNVVNLAKLYEVTAPGTYYVSASRKTGGLPVRQSSPAMRVVSNLIALTKQ